MAYVTVTQKAIRCGSRSLGWGVGGLLLALAAHASDPDGVCAPRAAPSEVPLPADADQGLYLREVFTDAQIGRAHTEVYAQRMPRCVSVTGSSGTVYSGCQYSSSKSQPEQQADPGHALELKMDIRIPPGLMPWDLRPAVLWLHGGQFVRNGRNSSDSPQRGRDFAKAGYVSAVADYRLTPYNNELPDGSYAPDEVRQQAIFEAAEDARNAVRHLRANAQRLHIDPTRIAVVGETAGGALALVGAVDANNQTQPGDDGGDYPSQCARADAVFSTGATLMDRGQSLLPDLFDAQDSPVQLYHALIDPHTGATWDGEVAFTCNTMREAGGICEPVQHHTNTHAVLLNLSGPYAVNMRPFLWRHLRLAELPPYAGPAGH